MEIRYFQIIIPLLTFFFVWRQIKAFRQNKAGKKESVLVIVFWLAVAIFSFFPDFISNGIAKIFGVKDNVNAILFFAIGMIFYFQLQLYKLIRKQDETLTELTRKIALDHPVGESNSSSKKNIQIE